MEKLIKKFKNKTCELYGQRIKDGKCCFCGKDLKDGE